MAIADAKMTVSSPEKTLQRELRTLSKRMSTNMVQQICCCLRRSKALTEYDVQVICSKPVETEQTACLLQTLLRKGHKACQMFFQCLSSCDHPLFQTVTKGAVKVTAEDHHHVQDSTETTGTVMSCVIHIHNSSLTNCIIGNNNDFRSQPSQTNDSEEQQMLGNNQHTPSPESPEVPSIQVESSKVEYVIIGDNNFMSVNSNLDPEYQEEMDNEEEDLAYLEE